MNHVAGDARNCRRLAREQAQRALGDRIEHRLHICRGARNDLEDFRCRRLLITRLVPLTRNQRNPLGCIDGGRFATRTPFAVLRRPNVLERCVFTALPRRLIASPEA